MKLHYFIPLYIYVIKYIFLATVYIHVGVKGFDLGEGDLHVTRALTNKFIGRSFKAHGNIETINVKFMKIICCNYLMYL